MRDFKSPWWEDYRPIEETDKNLGRFISTAVAVIVMIILIAIMAQSCTNAVVKTAELQEQYYSQPVQYANPAGYRMATPTFEQMEHLHHIMTLQEVGR